MSGSFADFEGSKTVSEAAGSSRKRNSSNHGSANSTQKDTAVSESKIRKVSRAPGSVSTCTASTSSSSAAASSSSPHKKELKFYSDQTLAIAYRTRSKTKNINTQPGASSSSNVRASKASKKLRKAQLAVPPTPAEAHNEHSPTPDPSSSNLTLAGSEASGFSFASSFGSETLGADLDSVSLRAIGLSTNPSATNFGLLNTMPTTSRNDGLNTSNSTSQPFLSRSQHVQRASNFFGSLVPRMQNLLGGSVGSSSSANPAAFAHNPNDMRVSGLLDELRSDNEIRQSEACNELSEMLLLGNEESLPNFPIRELVLCLIALLNKDHNFELMLSSCRCLTNLQEALPRSHTVLVETIPVLLQKLKRIEYIDVAEQALVILEVISRRSAKHILASSGIQSVISHVDFFSMPTQRLAFQIAANCATYVTNADFHVAQDVLPDLTQRLNNLGEDKRCVESICTFFNRLIENMRYHPNRLRQIAGKNYELMNVFQQLLITTPLVITSSTFVSLIKSLRFICTGCGDLAVALFSMEFSKTLRYLLIGTEKKMEQTSIDTTIRPSQQLREIVDLIGELVPRLPNTGVFEINPFLEHYANPMSFIQNGRYKAHNSATWFYQQPTTLAEDCPMKQFLPAEQLTLERNNSMGVSSIALEVDGHLCEIDFANMNYRVAANNNVFKIERRANTVNEEKDERNVLIEKNNEPFLEFVGAVFPLLVDIGSNSTCNNLRYDCVRVMIRMVYAVRGNAQLLTFLKDVPLAAYISSTLSSNKNLALIALAIQLVSVLLDKLPDLYLPLFDAEGVFFELKRKAVPPPTKKPVAKSNLKSSSSSRLQASTSSTTALDRHKSQSQLDSTRAATQLDTSAAVIGRLLQQQMFQTAQATGSDNSATSQPLPNIPPASAPPSALRYAPTAQAFSLESFGNRGVLPFLSASSLQGPASSLYQTLTSAVNQGYSQTAYNLNINSLTNQIDAVASTIGSHSSMLSNSASLLKNSAAERLENFIYTEALNLTNTYGESRIDNQNMTSMHSLTGIADSLIVQNEDVGLKPLQDLREVLLSCELSAFQINYSGIIASLIRYLTEESDKLQPSRLDRLRRFASVFMLINDNIRPLGDNTAFPAFSVLINKVILAIERLEQFNVRITNLGGNLASLSSSLSGSSSSTLANSTTYLRGAQALRYVQSQHIKCNLRRHPTCTLLHEWRKGRGSIKVDPFTSISAIERYLLDRGIGFASQDESSENDDVSDEDKESSGATPTFKGRIEILIGDTALPSDISILQAIQQYAQQNEEEQETISQSIFTSSYTLYFRGIVESDESSAGPSTSGLSTSNKNTTPVITESSPRSLSPMRKTKSSSSRLKKGKRSDKRAKEDKAIESNKTVAKVNNLERYLTNQLDHSLENDPCENGLVLLRIMYGLNTFWYQLYENEHTLPNTHAPILTQSCFYSQKLNSKVIRQLSDFLTVATQQIPKWTKSLIRSVPFIFPFITRRNFLYCTAFGRDRALMHLVNETNADTQDNEQPSSRLVPRLERRKISVNRATLLKDAQQAIGHLSTSKPLLEVSFDGEVGTGYGPTLEFYSSLSREIQKHSYRFWQGTPVVHTEDGENVEYTVGEKGLYPLIPKQQSASRALDSRNRRFEFIGRLMAQTVLDSRILDIPLASPFFKWILGDKSLGLADFEKLEPTIYNSLRHIGKLEPEDFTDLGMSFVYPGNDSFELMKGGAKKQLTYENYRQFVDLICQWRLVKGVEVDMECVRKGFQQVINVDHFSIFDSDEMEGLFCGCADSADSTIWSRASLQQSIRPDHGYTHDSVQITWLIDMLISFNHDERRKFLQFVTGSPRLPVNGFKVTVVRKVASYGCSETELPSVATCVSYLKIPPYNSFETFCERFKVVLQNAYSLGFHMS